MTKYPLNHLIACSEFRIGGVVVTRDNNKFVTAQSRNCCHIARSGAQLVGDRHQQCITD